MTGGPVLLARRVVGAAVALLAVVPLWALLPMRDTGLAGRATAETAGIQVSLLWSGFALLLAAGLLVGLLLSRDAPERVARALNRYLLRLSTGTFALGAGLLSLGATAAAARLVFQGRPNLVDALAQLTQARYMARGLLGGPAELPLAFFHFPNTILTEAGWFSQYPPGHILLLAAGMLAGAVWLVGPLLNGGTAALAVLVMERLLPERRALARGIGLLAGLSPMLMAQAATYMNHSSAAFFGILAVYLALRARDERAAWALGAGAAVAAMAAIRPLSAVAVMGVVAVGVWVPFGGRPWRGALLEAAPRWGLATLGGLPFLLAHLWYNRMAFGGVLTFGYDAAWGTSHGLGFHVDPHGNHYGVVEGLLYTAGDLATLNLNLLEIPIPLVAVAGLYLLLRRTALPAGERILALWALLPVLANALYWHHGYFMGPRMLAEFVPAWTGLAAVAVVGLIRLAPVHLRAGGKISPRGTFSGIALLGLLSGLVMGPQRIASYGGDWMGSFRQELPEAGPQTIVFLPATWESRIASRLSALGVEPVVVETALRQNPTCLVHQWAEALESARAPTLDPKEAPDVAAPDLDLERRSFEFLPRMEVGPGSLIRLDPHAPFPDQCRREVEADRFGGMDPFLFFWLGDLPGIEEGAPLLVRDLGPERNEEILRRYPERSAWMWGPLDEGGQLRLVPYGEGVGIRWGEEEYVTTGTTIRDGYSDEWWITLFATTPSVSS